MVGTSWNHIVRDQLYPKPKLSTSSTAFLGRPTDGKLVPKVTGLPTSILHSLSYLILLVHTVYVLPPSFTLFQDVARRNDFVVLVSDHLGSRSGNAERDVVETNIKHIKRQRTCLEFQFE